jgi:Cdc6-like AAA superfamily ATPase
LSRRGFDVVGGQIATYSPSLGSAVQLKSRRSECDALDRMIKAVRAGESHALVVRGEPGVGKTALLDYVA